MNSKPDNQFFIREQKEKRVFTVAFKEVHYSYMVRNVSFVIYLTELLPLSFCNSILSLKRNFKISLTA